PSVPRGIPGPRRSSSRRAAAEGSSALTSPELFDLGARRAALRRRERREEDFAVALRDDALVEHRDDAAVLAGADQATEALLQRDRGARDEVVHEGAAAVFVDAR